MLAVFTNNAGDIGVFIRNIYILTTISVPLLSPVCPPPLPPAVTAGGGRAGIVAPGVMSGYLQVGAATEGVIDHRG